MSRPPATRASRVLVICAAVASGAAALTSGCNTLTGTTELEAVNHCVSNCPDTRTDVAVDAKEAGTDAPKPTDADATVDTATEAATDATTDVADVTETIDPPDTSSCSNKIKDGTESDIDCGGSCPGCATGKKCGGPSDCLSKVCTLFGVCGAARCDDGLMNGDETAVDCGGSLCAPCGVQVFSAVGSDATISTPKLMGTLKAYTGKRIRVIKVGICGDSDTNSGPNRYVAADTGTMNFSWAAGQVAVTMPGTTTYRLTPTPVAGTSRGFTYQVVSHLAGTGNAVTLSWNFHADFDGLFCSAPDEDGTAYADTPSSVRMWVKYQYE